MFSSVRSKFKPYFKTQLGELYNADCMELMRAIPDKTIGLIVTDPPWLTTNLDFDKTDLDFRAIFVEFKRILKDNGWFFLVGTVEMAHEALKAGFKRKFEYIWVKPNFVPAFGAVKPASKHEIIYAFHKQELKRVSLLPFNRKDIMTAGAPYHVKVKSGASQAKLTQYQAQQHCTPKNKIATENKGTRWPVSVLYFPNKSSMPRAERTAHPTQKPVGLIETIIKGYSGPESIVLDAFCGSGTVAEVAEYLGRPWLAAELSPEYCWIIAGRVSK